MAYPAPMFAPAVAPSVASTFVTFPVATGKAFASTPGVILEIPRLRSPIGLFKTSPPRRPSPPAPIVASCVPYPNIFPIVLYLPSYYGESPIRCCISLVRALFPGSNSPYLFQLSKASQKVCTGITVDPTPCANARNF